MRITTSFRRRLVLAGLMAAFLIPVSARAQDGKYIVCAGEQLWLVNEGSTVRTTSCPGKNRVYSLAAVGRRAARPKTAGAREILSLLRQIRSEDVHPERLEWEGFEADIKRGRVEALAIDLGELPKPVREFFGHVKLSGTGFELIISSGVYYVDFGKYEELSRRTVSVRGADATIGEVLEEAKKGVTEYWLQHTKPYLHLVHPVTREKLDNSKTAADYRLKSGDILWLGSDVR